MVVLIFLLNKLLKWLINYQTVLLIVYETFVNCKEQSSAFTYDQPSRSKHGPASLSLLIWMNFFELACTKLIKV